MVAIDVWIDRSYISLKSLENHKIDQEEEIMSDHPLQVIKDSDAVLFESINATKELAFKDGKISKKHKLLIALAIDIAKNSENGIRSLTNQALECGATKQEIIETLRIAHYICGAGSIFTTASALKGIL
jgi:alkylhydroperoxidase/carboxymuconolactone decarboxylase family protein YurZ